MECALDSLVGPVARRIFEGTELVSREGTLVCLTMVQDT